MHSLWHKRCNTAVGNPLVAKQHHVRHEVEASQKACSLISNKISCKEKLSHCLSQCHMSESTSSAVRSLHRRKSWRNRGISNSDTFFKFSGLMWLLIADRQHRRKDFGESSSLSNHSLNLGSLSHRKTIWRKKWYTCEIYYSTVKSV